MDVIFKIIGFPAGAFLGNAIIILIPQIYN
jgi:hypothetical protein